MALEARGLGPISINVRITAVRKLAIEAADNGLLAPELASGIARIKGVRSHGVRVGNWLSLQQAQRLLNTPLQMPGLSGFDVIRKLPSRGRIPMVIIVTAFSEHAIKAFDAGAIDYLLKPISQDRLAQAVERAIKLHARPAAVAEQLANVQEVAESPHSRPPRKIVARSGDEYLLLNADEVFAFEADGDLVWIITAKTRYLATQSLKVIQSKLLNTSFRRLGNKRNELSDRQIEAITRIYGSFAESEHSKIFDNDDFGYRKITVERPLRLSFSATPEHLAAVEASRAFEGIATSRKSGKEGKKEVERGEALQAEILAALRTLPTDQVWMDREKFSAALDKVLKGQSLSVSAPARKAILNAIRVW